MFVYRQIESANNTFYPETVLEAATHSITITHELETHSCASESAESIGMYVHMLFSTLYIRMNRNGSHYHTQQSGGSKSLL